MNGGEGIGFSGSEVVEINAGAELVAAGPVDGREEQVDVALFALGAAGGVLEVAAGWQFGGDVVGKISVRLKALAVAHHAEAGIHEDVVAEAVLFSKIGKPGE